MRLGLERIARCSRSSASPQERLDAIHVVGTNGKSSTVRFAAAALAASGLRAGAYLSPHVIGWDERVQIDGRPVGAGGARGRARPRAGGGASRRGIARRGPDAVRGAHGRGVPVLAEAGVEACVGRGRPRRAPRRDPGRQRARGRPDERRARPPARARRHARADPGREAGRARAGRRALSWASWTTSSAAQAAALAAEAGATFERIRHGRGGGATARGRLPARRCGARAAARRVAACAAPARSAIVPRPRLRPRFRPGASS